MDIPLDRVPGIWADLQAGASSDLEQQLLARVDPGPGLSPPQVAREILVRLRPVAIDVLCETWSNRLTAHNRLALARCAGIHGWEALIPELLTRGFGMESAHLLESADGHAAVAIPLWLAQAAQASLGQVLPDPLVAQGFLTTTSWPIPMPARVAVIDRSIPTLLAQMPGVAAIGACVSAEADDGVAWVMSGTCGLTAGEDGDRIALLRASPVLGLRSMFAEPDRMASLVTWIAFLRRVIPTQPFQIQRLDDGAYLVGPGWLATSMTLLGIPSLGTEQAQDGEMAWARWCGCVPHPRAPRAVCLPALASRHLDALYG
jgi:hypothetical protein